MDKIFFYFFLAAAFIKPAFSQYIDIVNTGSFNGDLNGEKFINGIRFGTAENFFTIETSNDDFILRINWRNINSIDELEKQLVKLPSEDDIVTINFIDKKTDLPFVITGGKLHIYRKDILGVSGTLEFTALTSFINSVKNYRVCLENGNFRIDLPE